MCLHLCIKPKLPVFWKSECGQRSELQNEINEGVAFLSKMVINFRSQIHFADVCAHPLYWNSTA